MPRLIDAEALAKKVYRAWDLWEKKGNDCFVFSDIITPMLISMPTVDAEPVVRCKDCKWHYIFNGHNRCDLLDLEARDIKPDWFCAEGERKEDAETD